MNYYLRLWKNCLWQYRYTVKSALPNKSIKFLRDEEYERRQNKSVSQSKRLSYVRTVPAASEYSYKYFTGARRFQGSRRRISWGLKRRGGVCASSFSIIPWFFIDEVDTAVSQRVPGTSITLLLAFFAAAHLKHTSAPTHIRGQRIYTTLRRIGWKLGRKKDRG